MITIDKVNTAQAYIEGMLWAAYGVRIFSENVAEWQIEAVKKYAKKLKEEEMEHIKQRLIRLSLISKR